MAYDSLSHTYMKMIRDSTMHAGSDVIQGQYFLSTMFLIHFNDFIFSNNILISSAKRLIIPVEVHAKILFTSDIN